MKKLEIVRYLLEEIEAEQEKVDRYKAERERARKEASKSNKELWQCSRWNEPYPNKSRITENCKIVRRMMMEISREVHP